MSYRLGRLVASVAAATLACSKAPPKPVDAVRPGSESLKPGFVDTSSSRNSLSEPVVTLQPPIQLDEGGFALANTNGTELIALDHIPEPTRIRAAVCTGAGLYGVTYTHDQAGDPNHAGPETAANFGNLTGQIFRTERPVSGDQTCYLSADSALVAGAHPLTPATKPECNEHWPHILAAAKGRQVTKCWFLGVGPESVQLLAAQFAPRDTTILASLVVIDGTKFLFKDFPAKYEPDPQSTWRVDDQGIFSPHDFTILFLSHPRGAWVMGLTWAGEEGEDSYLLVTDSSNVFQEVTQDYRYWIE
jgi:hypothetical protein